jgi:hypothetical protein
VSLRKVCFLLLLGGVFIICLSGLISFHLPKRSIFLSILCLAIPSMIENGVLKSPSVIIQLSVSLLTQFLLHMF